MRLIDADATIYALNVASRGDSKDVIRNLVICFLLASPTVDAVPVIRCKDCVKYKIFGDGYCPWIEQEVEEDFFCADGKRKEE